MKKIKNFFTNNYYFSTFLIIFSFYFLMRGNFFGYYCPDCSFTSRDLMWLPSKILSENINFYELIKNNQYENFSGYKENSNYPMYSIITHFLLLPLGYIKFTEAKEIWLILNCILIFHIFAIFKQNILINKKKLILILIIFLLSKSLVYNIGLGQFSVICLYGFITFFYFKKFLSKIFPVIIATMKYTFAPVLGLYLVFTKNYLLILSILLINILSVLFFSYWFKENFNSNKCGDPLEINIHPAWGDWSLTRTPASLRSKIYDKYGDSAIVNLLKGLPQHPHDSILKFIDKWEPIRKNNWEMAFPEIVDFFKVRSSQQKSGDNLSS
jgi:hypothetical protein